MPGARDKIIINDIQFDAGAQAMKKALEAGKLMASEIENYGFQKQAHQTFTTKQEAICDHLHKSLDKAAADQWELNDAMRKWLDEQLGLNAAP